MSRYVFKMPDLGEGTVSAEVVAWHVKPGDLVQEEMEVYERLGYEIHYISAVTADGLDELRACIVDHAPHIQVAGRRLADRAAVLGLLGAALDDLIGHRFGNRGAGRSTGNALFKTSHERGPFLRVVGGVAKPVVRAA